MLLGAWIIVILIDLLALFGVSKISFDDGLERIFQSDTSAYSQYRDFTESFPEHQNTLLVLLQAESFTQPNALLALNDFVLELNLTDGVVALMSPFTFPFPSEDGKMRPLDPTATNLTQAYQQQSQIRRFLSADFRKALIVVQYDEAEAARVFAEVDALGQDNLAPHGVTHALTGYAVIRDGVIKQTFEDFLTLNVVGAILGAIVAAFALRSVQLAALTVMTAGTALLWAIGLMGLVGVEINVITIALPVVILVLSLADALHLCFETREQHLAGARRPAISALFRIGPACILASLTTAVAFAALSLSSSSAIAEFGQIGVVAVLLSGSAVLLAHGVLYTTLGRLGSLDRLFSKREESAPRILLWNWLPNLASRMPFMVTLTAIVVTVGAFAIHSTAQTNFSLYENTRPSDPARDTAKQIAETFGATGALHFVVPIASNEDALSLEMAHDLIAQAADGHHVTSALSFSETSGIIPEEVSSHLISQDGSTALISVGFDYRDAASTRAFADELKSGLAHTPLANLSPTGAEMMTSLLSQDMLNDLNRCFLVAFVGSSLLIMIWLRDPAAAVIAMIPNLLPIALVGAWLALTGRGIEFASGVALTVAFGIAIDDTAHVLNRLRLNLGGRVWGHRDQIVAAVKQVLPVLVVTSVLLTVGLLGTQVASLPSVVYFGAIAIAVFALALIADLLVLPACLIALWTWGRKAARR